MLDIAMKKILNLCISLALASSLIAGGTNNTPIARKPSVKDLVSLFQATPQAQEQQPAISQKNQSNLTSLLV
jgi:hypothetical protein